jgi:hypothetical protein
MELRHGLIGIQLFFVRGRVTVSECQAFALELHTESKSQQSKVISTGIRDSFLS